jgi:radical SAM superfamily enzyme YgiQ (UPF0313 family)
MTKLNQKNILLLHPLGYRKEAAGRDISRLANIVPPLGLASIASYLGREGIHADIIDCYARPDSDHLIRDYLLTVKPSFIGLSCTTSSFLDGIRIAALARSFLPDIKIVFGGPHVSALKNVQGIVYRDANGEICFTGYRTKAIDLDTLPFPAYEKLAGYPDVYKLLIFNYPKSPNSSCISSRGCPYSCSYCDRSVFRRSFRYNSADYMYEHLRYLKKRFNIRHIIFYDDQFTFNRQRIEDFTRMLLDRPLGMTFNCVVRAEHIDLELLRRLKASGCWMISLGIETGDEDLLAQHRRNVNLNLLAEKIRLIKKVGIRTKGLLMIGLPGETEDSIKKTMKYVFSLPIDDINLAKFTPFPGAPVYENIHKLGEFNEDWEKMDCMHFQFIPNGMTRAQMEELFQMFYKTHFLRPKVLWNYTTMLWHSPDSWLRFIINIADFLNFAKSNKRLGCT